MSIILFLILASLSLAVAALLAFIWAVRAGQFDDTCTPSMRLLVDEPVLQSGAQAAASVSVSTLNSGAQRSARPTDTENLTK
jgi:cbb3-type cytochrome oxidase maturation protein